MRKVIGILILIVVLFVLYELGISRTYIRVYEVPLHIEDKNLDYSKIRYHLVYGQMDLVEMDNEAKKDFFQMGQPIGSSEMTLRIQHWGSSRFEMFFHKQKWPQVFFVIKKDGDEYVIKKMVIDKGTKSVYFGFEPTPKRASETLVRP